MKSLSKMRYRFIATLIIISLFSMIVNPASAIPLEHQFADPEGDAIFAKFLNPGYSITNNTGVGEIDLVGVGYTIDRSSGNVSFELELASKAVINASYYFSMTMQFENETQKLTMRTYFSDIGVFDTNGSYLDLVLIKDRGTQDDRHNIDFISDGNLLYWEFNTPVIDLLSIFDNPDLPLSEVTAELEYSINGSSSTGGGDYYRDEFKKTVFDFAGGVQATNTAETLLEIFDPVAVFLYFGIPFIYIIIRFVRKFFG